MGGVEATISCTSVCQRDLAQIIHTAFLRMHNGLGSDIRRLRAELLSYTPETPAPSGVWSTAPWDTLEDRTGWSRGQLQWSGFRVAFAQRSTHTLDHRTPQMNVGVRPAALLTPENQTPKT